jgi:hypothetical protein
VQNISKTPTKTFYLDPITMHADCTDIGRGNNSIKSAEIKLDSGGNWTFMSAVDKVYNSSFEAVIYKLDAPSVGPHTVYLRCTDSRNNVGPVANFSIRVIKQILMVTKDQSASGGEQNWRDWLDTQSSAEGFLWKYDVVQRQNVIDGTVNLTDYSVALFADKVFQGSTGIDLATKVINYVAAGGRILLVDSAADNGAPQLGLGSSDTTVSQTSIYVKNNSHYMTSPYSVGNMQIYTVSDVMYRISGYTGTTLVTSANSSNSTIIGYGGNYILWGATSPYRFTANGNAISTRVFDYAIMNSSIT